MCLLLLRLDKLILIYSFSCVLKCESFFIIRYSSCRQVYAYKLYEKKIWFSFLAPWKKIDLFPLWEKSSVNVTENNTFRKVRVSGGRRQVHWLIGVCELPSPLWLKAQYVYVSHNDPLAHMKSRVWTSGILSKPTILLLSIPPFLPLLLFFLPILPTWQCCPSCGQVYAWKVYDKTWYSSFLRGEKKNKSCNYLIWYSLRRHFGHICCFVLVMNTR